MTDILQAARSYYGMDSTPVGKCEMYTNEHGSMRLVIEIPVNGSDFIAIGQRMKAMQEAESQQVEQAPVFGEDINTHAMRQQYNALSKAERGKYGSFGKYLTAMSNGMIDAPETEESAQMDAVWVECIDLEAHQIAMSSDMRVNAQTGRDEYLMQVVMLTEEQRQKAKESDK